ncbi:DoxX family protein [Kribbella sancticallisti]|uniref:DoxX family protein n=1 Tax=Kribbella sancticallisti TaxID=460087 RepID=A0ABN2EGN1_9ACTN
MNTFLWILAALVAALFFASGAKKLLQSKEQLAAGGFAWTEDFSPAMIKAIGVLEILAAIGLIVPPLLDIAPVLVPLAAAGLVLLMLGATITHLRRKELSAIGITLVLALLPLILVWGRFGPSPLS